MKVFFEMKVLAMIIFGIISWIKIKMKKDKDKSDLEKIS